MAHESRHKEDLAWHSSHLHGQYAAPYWLESHIRVGLTNLMLPACTCWCSTAVAQGWRMFAGVSILHRGP